MDTQIGYEQLQYAVWTVSYSNPIPSGYAQNRIWADSLNEALVSRRDFFQKSEETKKSYQPQTFDL